MTSQGAMDARAAASAKDEKAPVEAPPPVCPACHEAAREAGIERYGRYELFGCSACGLQFWEPREMPDARWYEQMYGGRDARTELDRNAAHFAKETLGLEHVPPLTISEFAEQHRGERFDVVTFFEVLEHQAKPSEFLQEAKTCLKPRGIIALSVPNRARWLTAPDVLDYPPNHFLRWNAAALMINMALRTGITQNAAAGASTSFRDVMQMAPEQAGAVLRAKPSTRRLLMQALARIKHATCFPLAVTALPYVRMCGYKGTYLYCLVRRRG